MSGPTTRTHALERLLVVVTGATSAAFLPFWLNWMRETRPDLQPRIVLTSSAGAFVSRGVLNALSTQPVELDVWEPDSGVARHVELAGWPDGVLVYPATASYVSRLARATLDSPSQMALHLFAGPVCVAPALPPGSERSVALQRHLSALDDDPRVVVTPTVASFSAQTRQLEPGGVAPLPQALTLLEDHHRLVGHGVRRSDR